MSIGVYLPYCDDVLQIQHIWAANRHSQVVTWQKLL